MKTIKIIVEDIILAAELNDNPTAQAIWEALPIEANANTWGDEIYFPIPVKMGLENDARADVAVGELGYWSPGNAFCVFFGPTPASSGSAPRAASAVNVIGRVQGDVTVLRRVKAGAKVRLEK